jgi:hypothetical protein
MSRAPRIFVGPSAADTALHVARPRALARSAGTAIAVSFGMRNPVWLGLLGVVAVACGSVTAVQDDAGSGHAGASTGGSGGASAGAPGAAGVGAAGSTGTAGTAGTTGVAGATGTAGASGTAGAGGHGGSSGTAGSTGHAGTSGTAGATGTAGSGAAGSMSGDAGVEDCTAIEAEFTAAMKEAKVCNPNAAAAQCQTATPNAIYCSTCDTHVQGSTTEIDRLTTKYTSQGCELGRACSALHCATNGKGVCVANDGGSGGTCTDDRSLATTQ